MKWKIELKKLSLIQQTQNHGKREEYMIKSKESGKYAQLNVINRYLRHHTLSTHLDKIKQDKSSKSSVGSLQVVGAQAGKLHD